MKISKYTIKRRNWKLMDYVGALPFYFKIEYTFKPKFSKEQKVFCIGRNKTGTTSMAKLLDRLGYKVAPQLPAELLFKYWVKNSFKPIILFAKYSGNAFQDTPFSLPKT